MERLVAAVRFLVAAVRFLVGLAGFVVFGLLTFGWAERDLPFPHHADHLSTKTVLLVLGSGVISVFSAGFAIDKNPWLNLKETADIFLMCLVAITAGFVYFVSGQQALLFAALGVGGLIVRYVARRHALGWIVDSSGERQKVDHVNRGVPIYNPTTRAERLRVEAEKKSERRMVMLVWGALGGASAALYYNTLHLPINGIVELAAGISGLVCAGFFLPPFAIELLYQTGYQDMEGHKVLDAEVERPGLRDVASQKAHGDAAMASEAEAIAFLNPKR